MFSIGFMPQIPEKSISAVWLLLILLSGCCKCYGQRMAASAERSCSSYKQVQQMFDWAKYGPNGCIKLKSLAFIFGDGQDTSPKLTASRYLTANLVFTGTVVHVLKDPSVPQGTAYQITVRVHCYLKGRLSSSEVVLSGFHTDSTTGLCLSISCQDGDTGLFFATYVSADDIRINENGFVKEGDELDTAMQALRCRENHDQVNFWPVEGQTTSYCRQIDTATEPTCRMSIHTARVYLDHAFINFESDLKPECLEGKDFIMRQLFQSPLSKAPAFSRLSGDGSGASRLGARSSAALAGLLLLTVRQLLLSGGVLAI